MLLRARLRFLWVYYDLLADLDLLEQIDPLLLLPCNEPFLMFLTLKVLRQSRVLASTITEFALYSLYLLPPFRSDAGTLSSYEVKFFCN